MKKEHIKSIVLTALVGMNFLLGSRILFNKKLWPNGYNFFNVENLSFLNIFGPGNGDSETLQETAHLTLPEKIIFNTGDQTTRFSLNSNNKEYKEILKQANEILITAFSNDDGSIYEATAEEWFSTLRTNSIYLGYYTEYDTTLFAKFLGIPDTAIANHLPSFSNIVISLYDNVTIYIDDAKSDKYYKIKSGNRFSDFKENVERTMAEYNNSTAGQDAINYSFDLSFDKTFGTQKTVIDSMVPIYSNTRTAPVISASTPWEDFNDSTANGIKTELVKLFNFNAGIANRYTEADGTTVYVENNATLKIHPNGLIEYKAIDNGLQLTQSRGRYNNISAVNSFASKINKSAKSADEIYISSGVGDEGSTLTFDYIVEGLPVKITGTEPNNAIYCQIEDGHIKEYRHFLRSYKNAGRTITTPEFIFAVDSVIQQYSSITEEVTINKLYLAYTDNGLNMELGANWIADVKDVVLNEEG